jgi:hypothetical protein
LARVRMGRHGSVVRMRQGRAGGVAPVMGRGRGRRPAYDNAVAVRESGQSRRAVQAMDQKVGHPRRCGHNGQPASAQRPSFACPGHRPSR